MNNSINQSNIRLCRAVEQHPCLYDRSQACCVGDKRSAYENAWCDIAAACGETVATCKSRWRNIRATFTRSVAASLTKRKSNRTRDFYLHDALEFYLPHIQTGMDETSLRESDDETDSIQSRRSTTSITKQNKDKKDEENDGNTEVVDERESKTYGKMLKQQVKSENNTKSGNKDNLGESKEKIENVLKSTKDMDNVSETKNIQRDNVEYIKAVQKDNTEDAKRVQKDNVVDAKRVQEYKVEGAKRVQEDKVVDAKRVQKDNSEDAKRVQKDNVVDAKRVQEYKVEGAKRVQKDNAEDAKRVQKHNSEDARRVQKDNSEDAKRVQKDNPEDAKRVQKDNAEDAKRVQKDNSEDAKRVQKDNAEDAKRVQKNHAGDIKGDKEEVVAQASKEQINKKLKNEEKMSETITKMQTLMPEKPRRGRKPKEVIKLEDNARKSVESRPTRRTQSITTIDIDEDSDDAANGRAEMPEKAKSTNKITQSAKGKGTFYITPKSSGTKFVIKKNNDTNDNNKTGEASENDMEEDVSLDESKQNKNNDIDNVDMSSDDMPLMSQSRFRRASKHVLDKPTPPQLRVRQKESKAKELKHSTERLKTLGKAAAQLVESPKKQPRPETNVEPNENQTTAKTRILCRAVVVDPNVISLTDTTTEGLSTKASPTTADQPTSKVSKNECQPPRVESTPNPTKRMEMQNVASTTLARVHQGVQCSLQPTSSDDEFLKTLKPYLHEMNARQKLHFKKKIFESLMEVFDSGNDFPTNDKSNVPNAAAVTTATAIIPKQLNTVKDEELRLVRELVAMVQAAKHTADIPYELEAEVTDTSQQMHTVSSFEKHASFTPTSTITSTSFSSTSAIAPPTLAVRGTPLSTSTPQNAKLRNPTLPNIMQLNNRALSISAPSSAPTPANMSPSVQRRVVRKLVKVNADGQVTYSTMPATTTSTAEASTNGEVLRRRIYRILPQSSTPNDQSLQHAVTTSGVGTFIVPRTTDVTANIESPRIRVGSNAPPGLTTTASLSTDKQDKNKSSSITVASGARPLMRRYSVCGALPNVTIERHTANANKFITTTANTREVQIAPKITISSRSSPPKVFSKDIFKLPSTSTRSINTSIVTTANTNTTVTVVVTNTTNSRNTPVVSVGNSSARTVPLTVGFNKFFRGDGNAKGTVTSVGSNSVAQNSYSTTSQAASNSQSTHITQPRISISSSTPRVSYTHYSNKSQTRVTVSQNPNTSRALNSQNTSYTNHSQFPGISRGASSNTSDIGSSSPPLAPPAFVACNPVKRSYERTSVTNSEKRLCSDTEKRSTEEPLEEDMLGLGIIASDAFDVLHIKEEPEDHEFEF